MRGRQPSVLILCVLAGCGPARDGARPGSAGARSAQTADGPLLVYSAAAIARPLRAVLDTFAATAGVRYEQETAASLELARKALELGGEPDVMVLADPDVFAQLLEPRVTTWYAIFGRNRIVLAYTARSRGATEIDSTNWFRILSRPGVEVGRADPNTDPSGYRTLLVWELAERYYREAGLYDRMLGASPSKNVRPREADQVALLEAGEYDYIWTYQNLAEAAGFHFAKLPDAVDLGTLADSGDYAMVAVAVRGKTAHDTVTMRGRPILFAVSIPRSVAHRAVAERFVAFVMSPEGTSILRRQHFDVVGEPVFIGEGIPATIRRP